MDAIPYPALVPRHWLRHGREAGEGVKVRKHKTTDYSDGSRHWDGESYEHQSAAASVLSLISHIKSQGVWVAERAFTELTDEANVGGRWLREHDDALAVFEDMWERAYVRPPKLSFEQVTALVLDSIGERPGVQQVYVRELAARYGWRNKGQLEDLLRALIAKGHLREERTYGPSGTTVTSRRFWATSGPMIPVTATTGGTMIPVTVTSTPTVATSARLAKALTTTLALALRAVQSTQSAKGHRTPVRDRTYVRLLTDERLRREGRRLLGERYRHLRPRRPRPSTPGQDLTTVFTEAEVRSLLDGIDLGPLPQRQPLVISSAWLPCVL